MGRTADSAVKFGFDNFELDVRSGELRTDGKPVKLQLQPFKVLAFLVARAGQVVTRDESASTFGEGKPSSITSRG